MNSRTLIAATLLLIAPLALRAQEEEPVYNESVVVKGSYKPVIQQAEKLNFPTPITDTLIQHHFLYSISPTRLQARYEPTRIRAARLVGEPATKLYNNYIRVGMGNYWSPLADLYWSSTRDKLKTYGIRLNHRSSWDKLPQYGPNHFGQTTGTLFGKYIVGNVLQLSADASYEHDHNLYYGGMPDSVMHTLIGNVRSDYDHKDYRASYNVASLNLGLRNMELDANQLGYEANAHLADLWALYGQNELRLNLAGNIHYGFIIAGKYRTIAYLHAEWDAYRNALTPTGTMPLGYSPTTQPDTLLGYRNIVKVNPYADFMFRGLQFHVGALAGWDGYTSPGATFHLFPDVSVSKQLLNNNLVLSLCAAGGLDANSLNSIRLTNPYIAPAAQLRATRHYDFIFHTRYTLSKKLEANAEINYQLLRNDISFLPSSDYNLLLLFSPYYFDNNRLTVGGDITFVNDEMLTLRAGGHFYHYTLPTEGQKLLYRPDWDATLTAHVNYIDRWLLHIGATLLGRMQANTYPNNIVLPMRYGFDLGVEYRHNRALSFFIQADNLAFQRYFYWEGYPSQRGVITLGLTYTIN